MRRVLDRAGNVTIAIVIVMAAVARVAVGTVAAADVECLIQPYDVVAVSAPVEGLLESVAVERGDLVEQGTLLVTLESSAERAALEVARARAEVEAPIKSGQVRVEFGVRRFERTQDLFKKELVPIKEMDEAETNKVLAEIGLFEAEENRRLAQLEYRRAAVAVELRTIHSPITGVVVERLRSPGETTGAGPILKLARLDPLRVEAFVPVGLFGKLRVGMHAEVIPEVPLDGVHAARVTVVDRVLDATSGTFGVRLELPNRDYTLPAGLKCKLRLPQ